MPITFNCPCGKALRIADENAGKRIKCPACQAIGTAPGAAPAAPAAPKFELVEDEPPTPAAKPRPVAAKPAAKPADDDDDPGFTVEDDEDDKPKGKKKPAFAKGSRRDEDEEKPEKRRRRRDDDDDDDDEPRPRRRRPQGDPDAGKKIMYLIGGLVLAVVGIVIAFFWYQNGPHTGRRPYSGYILGACMVIVGIGTAIKGITGNFGDE